MANMQHALSTRQLLKAKKQYSPQHGILLSAGIIIDASLDAVWDILRSFERYASWNPFIVKAGGYPKVGEKLLATMRVNNRLQTFKPMVREVRPYQYLSWQGHLIVPGIFDGFHEFTLDLNEYGQVLFQQRERFTGILSPLIMKYIRASTLEGYKAMNAALKRRAEIV